MANVAYISDKKNDQVMKSLGMSVFYAGEEESFASLIKHLIAQQYILVYISESIYEEHHEVIDKYNSDFIISIIVLANDLHNRHIGQKRLKKLSEDATGIKTR